MDCPGIPLLVILHSCRRYVEINDVPYQLNPHNSHDFGRTAHAKLDVGFIFSVDENKDALVTTGVSDFATRLSQAFEADNDIFRATAKLGLRHSYRERFDHSESDDTFYDESKKKKAAFIVTVGEFDESTNGSEEKLANFRNADVEREGTD